MKLYGFIQKQLNSFSYINVTHTRVSKQNITIQYLNKNYLKMFLFLRNDYVFI